MLQVNFYIKIKLLTNDLCFKVIIKKNAYFCWFVSNFSIDQVVFHETKIWKHEKYFT